MVIPEGGDVFIDGILYRVGFKSAAVMRYNYRAGTKVTIPRIVNNVPVMHVAENAFKGTDIEIVNLPDTCRYIGEGAFENCHNLIMVSIHNLPKMAGLNIGSRAFAGCELLKTVDVPNGLLWLEAGVFVGCDKLELITGKLFYTRENVFRNCNNLLGLIIAQNAHISSKTFGNAQPKTLSIEGKMSRPSRNMFLRLKDTKILCDDQFPFWDLVYEGYHIESV
jgi:hypothetical protein